MGTTALCLDRNGVLWVGTFGGLVTFDGAELTPVGPTAESADDKIRFRPIPSVAGIELDQEGHMWCAGSSGQLHRYSGRLSQPTVLDSGLSLIRSTFHAADGAIWVGGYGLTRFDGEHATYFTDSGMRPGEIVTQISQGTALAPDSSNGETTEDAPVWIATNRNLYQWTPSGGLVLAEDGSRLGLFFDAAGHRWEQLSEHSLMVDGTLQLHIESGLEPVRGIIQIDETRTAVAFGNMVMLAVYDKETPELIPTDLTASPRAILEGPNGSIWLGTEPDGLWLLEPCPYRYLDPPGDGQALDIIGSFGDDALVGGSNFASRAWTMESAEDALSASPQPIGTEFKAGVPMEASSPFHWHSSSFVEDSLGQRFVGHQSGLHQWVDGKLEPVAAGLRGPVPSMASDDSGTLWASFPNKVVEFKAGTPTGRVWDGCRGWFVEMEFAGDRIYGGKEDRVYELGLESTSCTEIINLQGARVRGLHVDGRNDLWITTYGDGLYRRHPSGEFDHFDLEDGLPNPFLGWIGSVPGPTEDTHLWVSSNAGVIVVSLEGVDARQEDPARTSAFHLIQAPESNGSSGAALANGFLYLPVMTGVIAIDSRMELRPQAQPVLAIESVYAGAAPIEESPKLCGSADLEYYFSAALFPSSRSAVVEHRLLGYDSDWRRAGWARQIRYQDLKPGEYQFQLRGRSPGGTFGPALEYPTVTVHKYWFQRNDVRAAALVGLLMLILGSFRHRARQEAQRRLALQKEFEREIAVNKLRERLAKAEESERARIARELHDDFSQRLVACAMALKQAGHEPLAGNGASIDLDGVHEGIESLAKDLHELSRRLHPTVLEDLGLLHAIRSECTRRSRLASRPVNVCLESEVSEADLHVSTEVALSLFRVVQEALKNAVQHGNPTRVDVDLTIEEDEVCIEVADNGLGMPSDPKKEGGIGLASMRERMTLVGGSLKIRSTPGRGTSVTARAPIEASGNVLAGRPGH